MIRYSWILTLMGISSIVINMLLSQLVSARRINMTRVQIRDMGKLASATVSGIEMIETIKASGAENGFFEKWSGYQASVNTQTAQFTKSNMWLMALPAFVSTLTNTIITMVGVYLIIHGHFSEGMLIAFQAYLASFMAPAESLISAGQTVMEMRTDMERIDDVMQYPDDPCFAYKQADREEDPYAKLTGNVELKNVSFGYSRLGAPLIQDFSMTMKPGSRVAIVGASGSGKSTISKLISGLYQPWSGQILFDGVPASQISRSVFTGSLAVVDQEVILFEDTIANNIKMWDESIEDFEMILAARDAQLHDDIMQREGGYRYKIREGGVDFSGGQRQRMEIARVLAQDPTIIIMDEATSALDAKTEYDVVKAIQDRGITCIVVAHRLSTIRDCDEIIVLDKGVVVERGTHEELMALGGRYMELITSD
jgi:ABC-type bacteriocin/lantibiotic exporter with double-glycine peptidase domain